MEDYVNFETARLLKEAGFDWETTHYYTREDAPDSEVWLTSTPALPQNWNLPHEHPPFLVPRCSAPTLAMAVKWLREKHGFYVEPHFNFYCHVVTIVDGEGGYEDELDNEFESYESALSAGINTALELIISNTETE